jgi:aminopeptidase N
VTTSDLTGIATLEAQATQNLNSFNLDFIGFEITSITVNGAEAEFERDGQELTIFPATPLSENESFTVEVRYEGSPDVMYSQALHFQTGWVTYDGGVFVLSEPDGAASFFPANDHPLDKALFTFRVTVPEPYEVAANGLLVETTDNGDTNTFLFEVRDPMTTYLATININQFEVETMESAAGVPIRNYYAVGLPEKINEPFARQGEMIDHFSELFGPYPFEVYGALVMDTEFGAALENQTMSIFGLDMVDLNNVEWTEYVVAHELTHQWFGDNVSVADWSDIWLNEGFATYGEALWAEYLHGKPGISNYIRGLYGEVKEFSEFYPPPGNPQADDLFNGGVYYRGALTLHALRLEIGDEAFFETLKTYQERYAQGNASTEDFIAVAEEVSGELLDDLFEAWLYDEQLPPMPELGLQPQ